MKAKGLNQAPAARPVSKAPPPPNELSGRGSWMPPPPEPTQMPLDWPPYYPNDLKPGTTVIIGEALKKFPVQTQTLQLGKYVISKLTPDLCAAVQGKTLRADLALSRMSDLLGSLLVYNCDDSSERFRLEQELHKSEEWLMLAKELQATSLDDPADLDSMLGIYNRRRFDRDLAEFSSEASADMPLSMIMIDLDEFKQVNTSQGHAGGDEVLKVTASHVKALCLGKGFCYRWGGDETAILLRNYSVGEATALAERIRIGIEGVAKTWRVTASVGVASLSETSENREQLFADTDKAMYAAKNAGGNRVHKAELARSPERPSHR